MALHCVGVRLPIVSVALVVRVRDANRAACARIAERCGGVPLRVCSGTTYERPDTCLRKQRREQAAGLLSSVTSCILDTFQRFHNRNFSDFHALGLGFGF